MLSLHRVRRLRVIQLSAFVVTPPPALLVERVVSASVSVVAAAPAAVSRLVSALVCNCIIVYICFEGKFFVYIRD